MANLVESAIFSEDIYLEEDRPGIPEGFVKFGDPGEDPSGMYAQAYYNAETNELVVAYRGTEFEWSEDGKRDVEADLQIAINKTSEQQPSAIAYLEKSIADAQTDGKQIDNVHVTGHSLGGHLAQEVLKAVAPENGDQSFTGFGINAPGIGESVEDMSNVEFGYVRTQSDVVSLAGGEHLPGYTITLDAGPEPIFYLPDGLAILTLNPVAIVVAGADAINRAFFQAHSKTLVREYLEAHPNIGEIEAGDSLSSYQIEEIHDNPEDFAVGEIPQSVYQDYAKAIEGLSKAEAVVSDIFANLEARSYASAQVQRLGDEIDAIENAHPEVIGSDTVVEQSYEERLVASMQNTANEADKTLEAIIDLQKDIEWAQEESPGLYEEDYIQHAQRIQNLTRQQVLLREQLAKLDEQMEYFKQEYQEQVVDGGLKELLQDEAEAAMKEFLNTSLEYANNEGDGFSAIDDGFLDKRRYEGDDGEIVTISKLAITITNESGTVTFMDDGSFVWSDKDGNSGSGQVFEDSAGFELLRESVMEQYFVDDQGQGDDGNSAPIDDGHEYSDDNEADRIADIKDILASLGPEVIPPADTLNVPSDFNVDIDFSRLNYNLAISDPVEIDIDALREQLRRAQLNPSEPSDYLVNTQEFELEVGSDSIPIRLAFAGGAGDYTFEGFYGDGWAVLEGDDLHRADEKFGQLTTGNGGLVVDSAGRVARDIGDLQAGRYVDSAGNAYVNHQRVDEPFDFDALTPKQQQDLLDDAGIEGDVSAAERDEILRTKYGDGEGDLTAGEVYSLEVLSEDELADLTAQTTQVAQLQNTFGDWFSLYQSLDDLKLAIESGDPTAILLATENVLVGIDQYPGIGETLSLDGVTQVVSLAANVSSLRDALRDGDLSEAVEFGAQSLLDINALGGADNGFLSGQAFSGTQSVIAGARLVSAIEGGNIGEITFSALQTFDALGYDLPGFVSLGDTSGVSFVYDLVNADSVWDVAGAISEFAATDYGHQILVNKLGAEFAGQLSEVLGGVMAFKNAVDAFGSLDEGDYDQAAISAANGVAAILATNPATAAVAGFIVLAATTYQILEPLGLGWLASPALAILSALEPDKIGSARAVSDGEGGFDIVTGGNKDAFEEQAESILSGIAESFTDATENLPAGLVLIPERLPQIRVENGEIQIVYIDGNTGKMYVDKDVDIVAINNVQGGTADLLDGRLTFTPELNFNGPASLQFSGCDSGWKVAA